MSEATQGYAFGLIAIGAIIILSVVIRFASAKISLPVVVGYVLTGIVFSLIDAETELVSNTVRHGFGFLAEIGVIAILFRVGLESDLESLFKVLGKAFIVFISNFVVAGALGIAAILMFTDFGIVAALFVGAALSATSVGVSTAMWRDAGVLETTSGALLVDVAELDDISAIIVLGLLFTLVPLMNGSGDASIALALANESAVLLLKLGLFLAACYLFTRYLEEPLVGLFRTLDPQFGPMLFAFGIALLVAAAADLLGFSLAIGAMFAGLAFSSPPTDRLVNHAFEQIYLLFSPFFFVSIGLAADVSAMSGAFALGGLLLVVAVAGKVLGTGLPILWLGPPGQSWLFGMSMVPRAEIALIVMSYGLSLGSWAVPPELYGAMLIVSLATCIIGPLAVTQLLRKSDLTKL